MESNPQIHPLALGNINQTHNLIRLLAKRLLKSHKELMKEEQIEKIVEAFTEKLLFTYLFYRQKRSKGRIECKIIVYADTTLSDLMSKLYFEYVNEKWNCKSCMES